MLDLSHTTPAKHLVATGWDLDYLDHDLSAGLDLHDLDRDLSAGLDLDDLDHDLSDLSVRMVHYFY